MGFGASSGVRQTKGEYHGHGTCSAACQTTRHCSPYTSKLLNSGTAADHRGLAGEMDQSSKKSDGVGLGTSNGAHVHKGGSTRADKEIQAGVDASLAATGCDAEGVRDLVEHQLAVERRRKRGESIETVASGAASPSVGEMGRT